MPDSAIAFNVTQATHTLLRRTSQWTLNHIIILEHGRDPTNLVLSQVTRLRCWINTNLVTLFQCSIVDSLQKLMKTTKN